MSRWKRVISAPVFRTIRARLAVRHALMLAAIVLVIEGASYVAIQQFLVRRGDRLLESATTTLVRDLRAEMQRGKGVDEAIATTLDDVRFRDVTFGIRAIGSDTGNSAGTAIDAQPVEPDFRTVRGARVRTEAIVEQGISVSVEANRKLEEDRETLEVVQRAYAFAAAIAILLSAYVTWRMATAALAPVETLTARASVMGSRDLHERLPVSSPDDELGRLTLVLNGMLERLEAAFAQQRQFVADASHELRTPVAVLRTEIDVTRANVQRSPEEYRETLLRLDRVTARLERLVSDLFLLARADAGGLAVSMAPVNMTALALDTAALLGSIADERGVSIMVDGPDHAVVHGSEPHLERALLNVIDNALRFAPAATTVAIIVSVIDGSVIVDVTDQGPGVDPAVQALLFGRFRRTVAAEGVRRHDGAGLGLAIAHALVGMHGGTLSLRENGSAGATFRFVLPAAS